MKKILSTISILSLSFVLIVLLSISALADGAIFPPPDYYVYETGQEAAIFFDDGQETLILTTTFRGEAKGFGWVIPVPSKPEVTKGSDEVLENLRKIVAMRYERVGILEAPMSAGYKQYEEQVTVVETKKIDYLDVAVLTATDSQALAKWLADNGYQYPTDSAWLLNDYIQNQWFFIAVKVAPEAANAPDVVQGLAEGHITPLKIEFSAQAPVYPLRISGIEISSQGLKLSDNLTLTAKQLKHLRDIGYTDLADKQKAPQIFNQIVNDMFGQVPYNQSVASQYPLIIERQQYNFVIGSASQGAYQPEGNHRLYNPRLYCESMLESWFRNYFSNQGIQDYNYYPYQSMPINLYVLTNYKVEATGFSQNYGNWIKKEAIKNLGFDFNGKPLIEPAKDKYFLTHLNRYLSASEMAQMQTDLYFKPASDNKLVNAIELKGTILKFWLTVGIALAVLVGCAVVLIIWLKKPVKK